MAMGHISVLRERGAPPKNQIECKNRINSSCKLESYVCPVGSLSKLSLFLSFGFLSLSLSRWAPSLSCTLFTLSLFDPFLFLSRPSPLFLHNQVYKPARMTPARGKADHLLYFLLFYCQHESYVVSRAYEESTLYRQVKRSPPTFRGAKIILLGDTDYHLDQLCTREHLTLIK